MAKEYIYDNSENNGDYKIDWDKIEVYVQDSKRELNTANADIAIDHEIYCDYYGEQIGYLHFSEFHNVNSKDVHPSLHDKHYNKMLYINNILVNAEFRGWGIGSHIYKKFGEIYENQFNEWPVAQVFVNPIAEYAFRRGIEKGYIPEDAFCDELITRDYDENEKQQAKDLFNWLPNKKQKEFREKMKQLKEENLDKKVASVEKLDIRNLEITDPELVSSYTDKDEGYTENWYYFKILNQGKRLAYFNYGELLNYPASKINDSLEGIIEKGIHVGEVEVRKSYQNLGIGQLMYKKFGEIYNSNYDGWPVSRYFMNPIAEYAFRKAVAMGWISENALTEEYIVRSPYTYNEKLVTDLRNKLPENVRGPEQWALLENIKIEKTGRALKMEKFSRLRKIALSNSEAADLRSGTSFDYQGIVGQDDNGEDPSQTHRIVATLGGQQVGELVFTAYLGSQKLSLDAILTDGKYRDVGFEMMLLYEFNEIYKEQFSGWPLERHFTNPFNELKFRQALEVGWLSREMLSEEHITRDYNEQEQQLWDNTLRNTIYDDRVRGAQIIRRDLRKFASNVTDLRKTGFRRRDLRKIASNAVVSPLEIEHKQITNRMHKVEIRRDGDLLGDLKYEVYPERNRLYVNYVEIGEQYRQNGLAMLLYREFSKDYNENYQGWKISRTFINPVAEYTFNKAVIEGLFPEETLVNGIKRDYNHEDEELWYNELEPKLIDLRRQKQENV